MSSVNTTATAQTLAARTSRKDLNTAKNFAESHTEIGFDARCPLIDRRSVHSQTA